jgi:sulfate transport system permease protein
MITGETRNGRSMSPSRIAAMRPRRRTMMSAVPIPKIVFSGTALIIVRRRGRIAAILDGLIDLPFLVSPVIIGLALTLVYGLHGWFGTFFSDHGIQIIFAPAGMVLATVFVSLPYVVREVAPVLAEVGDEQEQAAATLGASGWQTFRRITLPSIRWGVLYGVILSTARALGEIGAVLVVSSLVAGQTLTLPLLVYQRASQVGSSSLTGAYAAATELAVISLVVLLAMTLLSSRRNTAP